MVPRDIDEALHDVRIRTQVVAAAREPTAAHHWMGVACACLAAVLYLNTLHHQFALDDFPTIYGNRLTTAGLKGIPTLLHTGYWYGLDGMNDWLYRPLSMVMFAIEWEIAPNSPALGHWINVLLYALSGIVVFRFLHDVFDDCNVLVPFVIAVLWIVHPIHTEVVANIKSRDELLAFLLSMLTLWECVRYVRLPRTRHLVLAGLYFFLALLAKESPITLVAIVPMTVFVFTRADVTRISRVMIPVGISAGVYLAIRAWVLTSVTGDSAISLIDNSLVAAPDFLHRQATAFRIGGTYIRLLFYPHPMSSDYSFRQVPIVGFDNPVAVASLILYLALAAFGVVRLTKRDPVGYGIFFYLIGLALVANVFFLTRSTMAERFLYSPSLGACIALVLVLARLFRLDIRSTPSITSLRSVWASSRVFATVIGIIVVASAQQTWARNRDWKNDTTLFSADSRHSPNSARAHFLYGNHMLQELKQGKVEPSQQRTYHAIALAEFKRAIDLYPAYAEPHMGIGEAYTYAEDYSAAIVWYREIVARNPRFALGYGYLGKTFVRVHQYDSAIVYLKKVVDMEPSNANAYNSLGLAYQSKGDPETARLLLSKALALDPGLRR